MTASTYLVQVAVAELDGAELRRLAPVVTEMAGREGRRNRQLELENDILKRAAAYFARENVLPKVIFPLVRELAADGIPVAVASRVLNISRSGYYDWLGHPESPRALRNKEVTTMIAEIHADSRGSYGSPRVHAELRLGLGIEVNRKRVERLMRQAGIEGIYRRKGHRNLVNQATEEDLVRRQFTVEKPDRRGWPTSPSIPPETGSCIARRSWMLTPAALSAGPLISARTLISSSVRWPWQSPGGSQEVIPRSCILTTGPVYFLGIREAAPRCRAARLHGYSG